MARFNRRAFMTRTASASVVAACPAALGQPSASLEAPSLRTLIDQERQRIQQTLETSDIPGAAVCLIDGGEAVWTEGFGVIARGSGQKVGPGTIFSVQSCSKHFTATAIMIAVQRGLLDLDRPITAYLPDFTVHSRFEPNPQRKMTLRLLLSHRAGFTHEAPVGNNYDMGFPDFEAHVRSISRTWLRYPVGERYAYSNIGVDLAGYILQTVAARPFADCVKSWLFDPLGMSDSTASADVYTQRADRAIGHEEGYAQVPLRLPLVPSGGVYTSARDMAAYMRFHLERGKTLLDEQLWREMHGFAFGGNYSLGVGRAELRFGETPLRILNHNGGGFGFGSVFNLYPEAGLAWTAMFNTGALGVKATSALAGYQLGATLQTAILTAKYGAQKPRLPVQYLSAIDVPAAQMEKMVGNWQGRGVSLDIKIKDGQLGSEVGPIFVPVKFDASDEVFAPLPQPPGEALIARYHPAGNGETARLLSWVGDASLDYNDGPHDPPGADRREWDAYLGDYHLDQWGQTAQKVKIHRKNGYLYLDELRLIIEHERGLFFTSTGEAVDFRQAPATYRNIRLVREA